MSILAASRGAWFVVFLAVVSPLLLDLKLRQTKLKKEQPTVGDTARRGVALPLRTADVPQQERIFVGPSITPEYLIGLFEEHAGIQATKLTQDFIGKWMKVSGRMNDVISTTGHFALLVFAHRPIHMVFRGAWIDHLAILKRGDELTVVGQITIIDVLALQIENCEIANTDSI